MIFHPAIPLLLQKILDLLGQQEGCHVFRQRRVLCPSLEGGDHSSNVKCNSSSQMLSLGVVVLSKMRKNWSTFHDLTQPAGSADVARQVAKFFYFGPSYDINPGTRLTWQWACRHKHVKLYDGTLETVIFRLLTSKCRVTDRRCATRASALGGRIEENALTLSKGCLMTSVRI